MSESLEEEPPAAAEPETSLELELFIDELEDELPPAAAPESIELDVPVCGHEQLDALGVEPPLTAEPDVVELLGSEVLPLAALEPEPVVEDWLVCALWSIVDDGLVVVALWFAETLLDVFWSPLPMFTPGLMLAPAFTSVLLMPTLASTPTFGLTFTPVLLEEDGEVCDDCVLVELCWVLVWAKALPNALITAAAVILTASCLALIIYAPCSDGNTQGAARAMPPANPCPSVNSPQCGGERPGISVGESPP
ncbi:MAG TPA: hypothetical protein VIV54_05820 [Burkholderiales bacterium]